MKRGDASATTLLGVILGMTLIAAIGAVGSCVHPGPIPVTPPTTSPDVCMSEDPRPDPGSCGDRVTEDRYRCVLCLYDTACVDLNFEYCVDAQRGCDDPRCKPAAARKKR